MVETLRFIEHGTEWESVEFRLGVLATALSRSKDPPPLARMLCGDEPRPTALDQRLAELVSDYEACSDRVEALTLAGELWERLGLTFGQHPWRRAREVFLAAASTYDDRSDENWLPELTGGLDQHRMGSLVSIDGADRGLVQVMNLHQTKGREADATIVVFRDGEYFGPETEPYVANSRLLYVALTRARNHVTVILGNQPHPLVAPFTAYAE